MLDYGVSGHYEEATMRKRKPSVCFVDDDPAELQRFRNNLTSRFVIGIGRTLDDALADLRKAGRKKPDLFVLDLYFPQGPRNTPEELSELHEAWDQYNAAQAHLLSVLGKLRQSTRGGEALAEEVWQRCRSRNYVFFTRKATLEEGMAALKRGALSVIKKPDPNRAEVEAGTLTEALDSAFRNRSSEIAGEFSNAIRKATWWWKHSESVCSGLIGLVIGYLASVLANMTPALLRAWR
jgi:DNA-binding NarL/FixJ family response regulator